MILYDHPASGNCMKVRMLLRLLGTAAERVELDLFRGETRSEQHLARNPDGRVPVLELDDGTCIAESNAILLYLAEDSPYLPDDRIARARVHQWLFFEQNRIEAELSVARFWKLAGRDRTMPEEFASRIQRGRGALESLDRALQGGGFLAGDALTVADLAVYAYTHCVGDAGIDLGAYRSVQAWIARVEGTPGVTNDLEPVPAHVAERPL